MTGLTTALFEGLKAHYRTPGDQAKDQDGQILLPEVMAPNSNRMCDLLRVGMWRSRGLGIDVHEIKASRSDWLRELDDPAKAEAWWPYCSNFWVVAPMGVVRQGELPEGWGLLNPPAGGKRRFRKAVAAASKQPKLSLSLLVEIVKRADNIRVREIEQLRSQHRGELFEAITKERRRKDATTLSSDTQHRLNLLSKLETAVGADIHELGWGTALPLKDVAPEELAVAVKEYTQNHVALQRRTEELSRERNRLAGVAEHVLKALRNKA